MTINKSKTSKSKNDRISNEELRAYRASLKRKLHSVIYGAFRRLKKETGLTQKGLAERLGVDPALISKRLAGDANITLNTLSDLARAMEMTIDASAELWKDNAQEKTYIFTMDSFAENLDSFSIQQAEPIRMVSCSSGGPFSGIAQWTEMLRASVENKPFDETSLVKSDLSKFRLKIRPKEQEVSYH